MNHRRHRRPALLAAAGLLLAATLPTLGAAADEHCDTTWTGEAVDGDDDPDRSWDEADNWSDGVPGTGDTACLPPAADAELVDDVLVAGLDLAGELTTPSGTSLEVTSDFTWRGGHLRGVGGLSVLGTATLMGGQKNLQDHPLVLAGTTTWTSGELRRTDDPATRSTIHIPDGATLLTQGDDLNLQPASPGDGVVVEEGGTWRHESSGAALANWAVVVHGELEVTEGTVRLRNNHVDRPSSGAFRIADGATLEVGSIQGSRTILDGATVDGPGTFQAADTAATVNLTTTDTAFHDVPVLIPNGGDIIIFDEGTTFEGTSHLTVDGRGDASTPANQTTSVRLLSPQITELPLTMSGGELRVPNPLTAPTFDWTGGEIQGAGSLTVPGAATLGTTSRSTLQDVPLRLEGPTSWLGGDQVSDAQIDLLGASRLDLHGDLDLEADARIRVVPDDDQPVRLGDVTLSGDDSRLTVQGDLGLTGGDVQRALRGAVALVAFGDLTDQPDGDPASTGTFVIDPDAVLAADGDYTQGGDDLTVNGTLSIGSQHLRDGRLDGGGTVENPVINRTVLAPGDPTGTLTVGFAALPDLGDGTSVSPAAAAFPTNALGMGFEPYQQTEDGALLITVAGAAPGEFSHLDVRGPAVLDGHLEVTVTPDADLAPGDELAIVTTLPGDVLLLGVEVGPELRFAGHDAPAVLAQSGPSILGEFATVALGDLGGDLGDDLDLELEIRDDEVVLVVTGELPEEEDGVDPGDPGTDGDEVADGGDDAPAASGAPVPDAPDGTDVASDQLPRTGLSSSVLLVLGLGLIALGVPTVRAARVRATR